MATLQKIRSKGPLLVIVIGLALFAFIAGDAWKVFQPHAVKQDVGVINGKKISVQDYQDMVDEYSKVQEKLYGRQSSDEDLTRVRDYIWNSYVQYSIIKKEADKLGLTVTDMEIKALIKDGTSPMLAQTPFYNPQTGSFDKEMMDAFINRGNPEDVALIINYIEEQLRRSLLINKFQSLLAKSVLSNPVEAECSFNDRSNQADMLLVALPYSSIVDSTITVSNSDIKDLYSEKKEQFKNTVESRDLKYIDVVVTPSEADRKAVLDEVTEYSNELAETTADFASFVRTTGSTVSYADLPVTKSALPTDIANRLDSVATGEVFGPFYTQSDDSYNAFKVLAKVTAPDSVQFRQIQVVANTVDETKKLADSITTAIKGGADFAELAKKYGQTGESTWLASKSYETAQLDINNAKLLNTLNTLEPGSTANLEIGQMNIILQVVARKAMVNKYKVAVVKRPVEFSKETYNRAYNDFSQFVAQNGTIELLEKNAEESGYRLLERSGFMSNEHNVCGVKNTREALKWVFDAKKGDVSPLYECGDNNQLLVVAVTGINEEGYLPVEKVAQQLRLEVVRDKKAAQLTAQLANVKSIDEAKAVANAVSDTVKHVTFAAPTYVALTHSSEPALSGSVAKAEVNKLSAPVKGNGGVYVFQVINKEKTNDTFDEKAEEATAVNMNLRYMSRFMSDLYEKAGVKDTRYLFF